MLVNLKSLKLFIYLPIIFGKRLEVAANRQTRSQLQSHCLPTRTRPDISDRHDHTTIRPHSTRQTMRFYRPGRTSTLQARLRPSGTSHSRGWPAPFRACCTVRRRSCGGSRGAGEPVQGRLGRFDIRLVAFHLRNPPRRRAAGNLLWTGHKAYGLAWSR